MTVSDVTPAPDFCEAFIGVNGAVKLAELVAAEVRRKGLTGNHVLVELPPISVR